MADDSTRDELAQLRARVAQLETRQRPRSRLRQLRRFLPLGLVGLLIALMPLSLLAATPFTDLDQAQNGPTGHNPNIEAIFNAGITKNCGGDPTVYCPKDNVTREQMASFLARTAGLGDNKPVANAAHLAMTNPTAGGPTYAANDLVRVAGAKNNLVTLNQNYKTVVTLDITAPKAGFVLVTGTGAVYNSAAGCPCEVLYQIYHLTKLTTAGFEHYLTAGNDAGGVDSNNPMAITYVIPVEAGLNQFQLQAHRSSGTGSLIAFGQLSALFVPFGATGGATITETGTGTPPSDNPKP